MRLYPARVRPLADALDLDVARTPVCLACLWEVASPIGRGDEREAKRSAREMTPYIWEEGLARPALRAVRRASTSGIPLARECLADLEQRGGRSVVARAIVLRLGAELAERERVASELREQARPRLSLGPPDWN